MNNSFHILALQTFLAAATLSGCASEGVRTLQTQELMKPYGYEENRIARERGFAVVLEIDDKGIKLFGKCVCLCDVKSEIQDELKRQNLSAEEFHRVPFLVKVVGDSAYGGVLKLLDIGEDLGFKVKGFMYVDIEDDNGALMRAVPNEKCLPQTFHGVQILDSQKPKNWCVVDVLSDNLIWVDGEEVADWDDWSKRSLRDKFQNYRHAYGKQGYEVVIRAHGDVGISLVWRVLNINISAGGYLSFLVGSELEHESISRTQLISQTYRMIMVGIPCPDGFYWGVSDE